jgi:hypothetical protein
MGGKCFAGLDFRSSFLHQMQIKSGEDKEAVYTHPCALQHCEHHEHTVAHEKNYQNLSNANHKQNSQNTKDVFWKEKGKRK